MKEFVIIGGGPVGLWTAIQLKKRNKSNKVTIYERHDVYQRAHVLRLDHWSMILYNKMKNDELEKEFIEEVTGLSQTQMMIGFTDTLFIRTNDFEKALKNYSLKLGVDIIKKRIKSPEEVEELHPHCKYFIAADGAKSLMRLKLLGADSVDFEEMQRIIELKFEVKNETKKSKDKDLSSLLSLVKLNYKNYFLSFEYVGEFNGENTPITTRVFLNADEFNKIPDATFNNPIYYKDLAENIDCKNTLINIDNYLNFRKNIHLDNIDLESLKITKLILSVYAAKKFVIHKEEKDIAWFLTGDAAIGVPYFRALNSGMMLSSRLAQIVNSKTLNKIGNELKNEAITYSIHRQLHIKTEFGIAKLKNNTLNLYTNFIKKMKN